MIFNFSFLSQREKRTTSLNQ